VFLTVDEVNAPRVSQILEGRRPIDIDRAAKRWRGNGWAGYDAAAEPWDRPRVTDERRRFEAETGTVRRYPR